MKKTVIGLVGEVSSGKGVVINALETHGFVPFSLSDILRQIATSVGLNHERETLITLGNTLRGIFGSDILARGAKRLIDSSDSERFVVESIRHPSEAHYLQQETGALIIGVAMSPERRFELMKERGRLGDPETWEQFQELYEREQGVGEQVSGLQVQKALELADVVLANDGSIKQLHSKVDEILLDRGLIEGGLPGKERF